MTTGNVTIVHLSELHLQPEGVHWHDVLDGYEETLKTLEHIKQYAHRPDCFVITGDLVLGAGNAEAGYPQVKELLDRIDAEFDVPILLALGNGDATEPFRRIILGEAAPVSESRYYYSHVGKGLKVIVLDSHVDQRHYGDIDEGQLDWLGGELAASPEMDFLLALHHPPGKIVLGQDEEELVNASQLAEVVDGYNVLGILSGHVHMAYLSSFAGVPCAVGNGVCSSITWCDSKQRIHERTGGGYNLIHIRDRRMLVRFMDITSERPTLRWQEVEWAKLREEEA